MKSPEGSFSKKIGKGIRNTLGALVVGGMAAHMVSQENPSTLKEGDISTETIDAVYKKFDPETAKELHKIEQDYIESYKTDYPESDSAMLAHRFEELIAKYGEGLRIVLDDRSDKTIGDKLSDAVFTKILGQSGHRAHYAMSRIFYENQSNHYVSKPNSETDSTLSSVPNLRNFMTEFSHHINQDSKIGRVVHYGEGLIEAGFRQKDMYSKPRSIEFQAHSFTQSALAAYLYAKPENMDVSFEKIKNNFQSLYEQVVNQYSGTLSENAIDIIIAAYTMNNEKHLTRLDEYQKEYLATLSYMEGSVERTNYSPADKKKFFESLITWEVFEQEYHGEMLKRYVDASQVLFEASRELKKKNFLAFEKISASDVFSQHPELLGFIEYHLASPNETYDDFLESLTLEESRNYLDHALPLYVHMVASLEVKLDTNTLTPGMCRALGREVEYAESMSKKTYRDASTKEDLEKQLLLKDLKNYLKFLELLTHNNRESATVYFEALSPSFYRYEFAQKQLKL